MSIYNEIERYYIEESFKPLIKNQNNMKQVKIDIPKGYEIDKEKSTFENIVFKKVGEHPIKLEYIEYINYSHYGEYKIFAQLVETCKQWNEIDGFVPKEIEGYGVDSCYNGSISAASVYSVTQPLHFKDQETAELFLETFRTEIEQVKHLI